MTGSVETPAPRGYAKATLHLAIDETEHQRRQDSGLRPILDLSLIHI